MCAQGSRGLAPAVKEKRRVVHNHNPTVTPVRVRIRTGRIRTGRIRITSYGNRAGSQSMSKGISEPFLTVHINPNGTVGRDSAGNEVFYPLNPQEPFSTSLSS